MLNLKFDEKLHHHYIIYVGVHNMQDKDPGKLFLKFKPIYFTNKDITNFRNAILLSRNPLWKTTRNQALEIFEVKELASILNATNSVAKFCCLGTFHFSMEEKLADELAEEYFSKFIELCNTDKESMEVLKRAKIS